jgi:TPR repeat protein
MELENIRFQGVAIAEDLNEARRWMCKAAKLGHVDARKFLVWLDGGGVGGAAGTDGKMNEAPRNSKDAKSQGGAAAVIPQ